MLECLWLAREVPFPLNAGDRLYAMRTAAALAGAGVRMTFAGLAGQSPPPTFENITWHIVPGRPHSRPRAVLSVLPLAGRFATRSYRAEVAKLASSRAWDVVVVDQYGMGWIMEYRRLFNLRPPIFVFMTHDHEESVTRLQAQEAGLGIRKRLYLLQNHYKTRWLERRTARTTDLTTTITEAEARQFEANSPGLTTLVNRPGYDGRRIETRAIDAGSPRAAVMFGSFRWSAKQTNLRLFMEQASAAITDAGIELRIVGDMSDDMKTDFSARYQGALFTGFVEDAEPFLDARIAIVAEPIGGGFKMKMLEYIFRRLPIFALEVSVDGLPDAVRRHIRVFPDLASLGAGVAAAIDDTDLLNEMQRGAYEAARDLFDWSDRGRSFKAAIEAVQQRRATAARSTATPDQTPVNA